MVPDQEHMRCLSNTLPEKSQWISSKELPLELLAEATAIYQKIIHHHPTTDQSNSQRLLMPSLFPGHQTPMKNNIKKITLSLQALEITL